MSDDIFDDPDAAAWAQSAIDDMLPKLRDSFATVSLVPEEAGFADIKFALEIGMTILLDKPLILAVVPGRRIPARLQRAADELVEFDEQNPQRTGRAIRAAIARIEAAEQARESEERDRG